MVARWRVAKDMPVTTIRDVAKAAGVSVAAVSSALNRSGRLSEETRRRIQAAIEAIGYAPNMAARSLRTGSTKLIGMIVGNITNPFSANLVRTVEREAITHGFSVIVANADGIDDRVPAILDHLRGNNVAGMILAPMGPPAELIRRVHAPYFPPVVTIDHKVAGLERDFIGMDNRAAIRMIVDYLVRLGHRRIALISGHVGRWTADERHQGFLAAMADAGLDVDPSLVHRSGYEGESAYAVTASLLTRCDRPSALIAANNVTALGALQSCIDLGFHCPRDLSLAGVDDVPWSGLVRPRVTVVAQPIEEMALLAIRWLLERIADPVGVIPPRERLFLPSFVVGESCRDVRRRSPDITHSAMSRLDTKRIDA